MSECEAVIIVSNAHAKKRALLVCFREQGHPGMHYDEGDNIAWKEGNPDDGDRK